MTRSKLSPLLFLVFWYLALFPGRLGFDNAKLMEVIKTGESTDWWTGGYFWFIKALSFNGNSIWLVSLTSIISGFYAIYRLIQLINFDQATNQKIFTILCVFPLAPVFFLTVSHDAFQCTGLLLVTANLGLIKRMGTRLNKIQLIEFCLGLGFLTFTYSGQIVSIFSAALLVVLSKKSELLLVVPSLILVIFLSGLGVTNEISSAKFTWPMIADMKCVIQHPSAKLSQETLSNLIKLAPLESWEKPVSCRRMDEAVAIISVKELEKSNKLEILKSYISVVSQNPQIVLMSHIQKNLGLLPPPFFQPPKNMTSWDVTQPIGTGTDASLQAGGEVLHSSIDLDRVKVNLQILKPFEALALLPVFLINQASWFWGWAGMWSYFFAYIIYRNRKRNGIQHVLPTTLLCLVLLTASPESATRYAMFFTLSGFTSLMIIIVSGFEKHSRSNH